MASFPASGLGEDVVAQIKIGNDFLPARHFVPGWVSHPSQRSDDPARVAERWTFGRERIEDSICAGLDVGDDLAVGPARGQGGKWKGTRGPERYGREGGVVGN